MDGKEAHTCNTCMNCNDETLPQYHAELQQVLYPENIPNSGQKRMGGLFPYYGRQQL